MKAIQFRCMCDNPAYTKLRGSLATAEKLGAIHVVHSRILPEVLSNMIENRGRGAENKAKAGAATADWVTQTDKDNQIGTVRAFQAAFPHYRHIGEEETSPPVDRMVTTDHLSGMTVINDGVDGTSFFAFKDSNKFGPLSFIVKGHREYAFQIAILSAGMPIYAGIFAPQLRLDGKNDISVLEAADFMPGAWLNGESVNFSAGVLSKGDKPLICFLDGNPYKADLMSHLLSDLGISDHFPMVSSVSCETVLLVKRQESDLEAPFPFALYSANAAKIWDWLPGGFIVDKSGGISGMIKRGKQGFFLSPLFPLAAKNLVPCADNVFAPEVKWPVVYGHIDTVTAIIKSMNRWQGRDTYFPYHGAV